MTAWIVIQWIKETYRKDTNDPPSVTKFKG